jgi:hypothetical protein
MDKTKSVVTSGAQKLKSGTSTGFKWIKEKVQKKASLNKIYKTKPGGGQ